MSTLPGKINLVMDTNFLLIPYQFHIDVFSQMRELVDIPHVIIPSSVIDELEKISQNQGPHGAAARFALLLLAREKWTLIQTSLPADRWIVEFAKSNKVVVCTNDKRLRQKLRKLKIRALVLKTRGRLGVV